MKKALSLILALLMVFCLFACGEKPVDDKKEDPKQDTPKQETETKESEPTPPPPAGEGKAYPHCNEDGTINLDKIAYFDDEYDYTQNEKFKVCYIAQQGSPLYAMSAAAYEHWAPFFNCEWIPFMNADGDSDKYMTLLQTQLDAGVRGFVLDPDSTIFAACADLVAEYPEAAWMSQMSAPRDNEVGDGIPDGGNMINNYIGFDNYDAGAQQAYKLLDWKEENYPDVDWSKVGVLAFDYSTSPPLHIRGLAVKDVMIEAGVPEDHIWIGDCVADGLSVQAAMNVATPIISTNSDIEVWLVGGIIDDWAQGAASVLATSGLTDTSCCVAFGGSGLIAQLDGGQYDSFRYALFTAQLIMGEPILGSVYAYLMGWATPDTIYPSWVNPNDCGVDGHTYSNVLLPTSWLSKDEYKEYLEWCDLYAHADEFPYDKEGVTVDINDFTAFVEPEEGKYAA